jgi:flagella basal body P-ring formation protein FlgA
LWATDLPNMSPNRASITCQFATLRGGRHGDDGGMNKPAHPLRAASLALRAACAAAAVTLGLGAWANPVAQAQPAATANAAGIDTAFAEQLQRLATDSAQAVLADGTPPVRIAVELGQLDPRLQLAPCAQIQPYLPAGTRPLGRTRIGLRCIDGQARWNVFLPVTVRLFAQAVITTSPLPMGTLLQASHFTLAEVDLAERPDPAFTVTTHVLGRTLARPLGAGDTLRRNDLKPRQYFQAGDLVRVVAVGNGYAVSAEGQALSHGIEGQPARVRTESGRIISGLPAGDRRVEVAL